MRSLFLKHFLMLMWLALFGTQIPLVKADQIADSSAMNQAQTAEDDSQANAAPSSQSIQPLAIDDQGNSLVELAPYVTASITLNQEDNYQVGDTFSYTIILHNQGFAPAEDYQVNFPIMELVSKLANDLQAGENSEDLQGFPFLKVINRVELIGENSQSQLSTNSEIEDQNLTDTITLARGEKIQYSVTVQTSVVSIGTLPEISVEVLDETSIQVDYATADSLPLEGLSTNIVRAKSTDESEYTPGDEVVYRILVQNTNSTRFANNVEVYDNLQCIETEHVDGTIGPAFSQWKLEVESKQNEDLGTDAGAYNYGVFGTQELRVYPDLAPSSEIVYLLTAKVSETSVGKILDNTNCQDNVKEGGTGIKMPDGNLYVKKEVSSHYYSAGHELVYTITITNSGEGYALDVPVVDELSKVTTTNIKGDTVAAYFDWTIRGQGYSEDGQESDLSNTGLTDEITKPTDLNVLADIAPKETIIYTIETTVFPNANGEIRNEVVVDNTLRADVGSIPFDYDVLIEKQVDDRDWNNYTRGVDEVVYTITLTNPKGNGFATDVRLKDEISAIQAELLEPAGTMAPAFKSWTIDAEVILLDEEDIYLEIFTEVGDFPDGYSGVGDRSDGDINIGFDGNAAAQIPAGVQIVYTITAQIDRSEDAFADAPILWGEFSNQATVSSAGSTYSSPFSHNSAPVNTDPNIAKIVLIKTSETPTFTPGEEVTFHLEIRNRGWGYANDIRVVDHISELNFFDSWTIEAETDTLGGTHAGNFADNQDIDTTIDIAPALGEIANGEQYGYVIYHITGIVKQDYDKDEVANIATVYDPVTGLGSQSSAEVSRDDAEDKFNVSIVKVSNVYYTPGEEHEYIVYLQNNGEETIDNLTFIDAIKQISNPLANDKDGQYEDFDDQNPFESWSVNYDYTSDPTNFTPYNTDEVTTTLSLEPTQIRQIHIRAKVKDNALDKITNTAYIYRDRGLATEEDHRATDEALRANPLSDIKRSVDKSFYSPGDTLTYTVEVTSQIGYYNDVHINEAINDLQVELIDGSMGNPFYNPATGQNEFTVTSVAQDSHNGGTTDGTLDGVVADNQNIDTYIDVGPGDKVTFTVVGKVRIDAIGKIDFGGDANDNTIVTPYSYQIKFSKTTTETNYTPGDILTYNIVVENVGQGNARDINVVDYISQVMVNTTTGTNVSAFPNGWTIEAVPSGSYPDYVDAGTFSDDVDIDTQVDIPLQTKLTYVVKAQVADDANGEIVNELKVNGDTVSTKTKPYSERNRYSLTVTKMDVLNKNGDVVDSNNLKRYMPGGWVEYTLRAENLNNVNVSDLTVFDDLSSIETDYFDGTRGPAFEDWEITASKDNSSVTNVGSTAADQNIDTKITLASNSLVDGNAYVEYVIRAHISEKAVGAIANSACFEAKCGEAGAFKVNATTINMLPPGSEMTKEIYEPGVTVDDNGILGNTTVKSTYSHLDSDNKFTYVVSITNDSRGTEYTQSLQDIISDIKAAMAEDGSNGSNPTDSPFASEPTIRLVTSNDTAHDDEHTDITTPTTYSDIDIDTPITIAPYGWMHFIIDAEIAKNTLGEFTNTATYDGLRQVARLTPKASNVSIEKSILTLGGQSYSPTQTYLPGQEVQYQIVVRNDSDSWANDIEIVDRLSDISVEVMGGASEDAFSQTTISHTTGNPLAGTSTYVPSYTADNADLDIEVDIAPRDTLTFTITATIRDDAVGEINANQASADSQSVTTDPLQPTPANINATMALISTSADPGCTTATGCQYEVFGEVVYAITLTNDANSGIANDVKLVDAIDTLTGSNSNVTAFSNYRTELYDAPADESNYDIKGQYQGGVPLNANIDLKADQTLVFYVTGLVAGNLNYEDIISNTATLNGNNIDDTIVLDPIPLGGRKIFSATKTTDTPTYVPNGDVRYYIDLYNSGQTNFPVQINDIISSFMVETADGSMQVALSEWDIDAQIVKDGNDTYTSIDSLTSLPANSDISNATVYLGATTANIDGAVATHIRITINGKVRADAIGEFTNEITAVNTNEPSDIRTVKLSQGYITPEPGEISVTKVPSRDPAQYSTIIGDANNTISFDVTLTNSDAGGYAVNTVVSDPIQSILTQLDGEDDLGVALSSATWNVSEPILGTNTKMVGSSTNDENGYLATFNIAPNESVSFTLSATVNPKSIGDITNEVQVTSDNSGEAQAQATYTPQEAQLELTKSVDKEEYSISDIGEQLTYTVVLKNTGGGWANNLRIKDEFSKVRTDVAGDTQGKAFDVNTIEVGAVQSKLSGNEPIYTQLPTVAVGEPELVFSLAPNEQVEFTLKANLNDNVVGTVTNVVELDYDGTTTTAEASSEPKEAVVSVTKNVQDEQGNVLSEPTYAPSQQLNFAVTIENSTDTFANNINIEDLLSSVTVLDSSGNTVPAFSRWFIKATASDPRTSIDDFNGTTGQNLDYSFDLAPSSTATFTIEAFVIDTAVGDITNQTQLRGDDGVVVDSDQVTVSPLPSSYEVEKVSVEEKYEPGETLSFLITVVNTSDVYLDDYEISDDMTQIEVSYLDGSTGPAFKAGTIELTRVEASDDVVVQQVNDSTYLLDMPPNQKAVFKASGVVVDEAIGEITNTVYFDDVAYPSNPVPSQFPILVAQLSTPQAQYVPGEPVTYVYTIANQGSGLAKNVYMEVDIKNALGTLIGNIEGQAFEGFEEVNAVTAGDLTSVQMLDGGENVFGLLDLDKNGVVTYTFQAFTNQDLISPIDMIGYYLDFNATGSTDDGSSTSTRLAPTASLASNSSRSILSGMYDSKWIVKVGRYELPPITADLELTKVADKTEYESQDTQMVYTLTVTNPSGANAVDVNLLDMISALKVSTGRTVFTSWEVYGEEYERADEQSPYVLNGGYQIDLNDEDLDLIVDLKNNARNRYQFTITGQFNKGINDNVTNVFTAILNDGTKFSVDNTVHVQRIPDNTGLLNVIKQAFKDEAQVGDVIEYEVLVTNPTESDFFDINIEDKLPGSFQYMKDSSEVVRPGADGQYDSDDDEVIAIEPTGNRTLVYHGLDLLSGESIRIRYLLRVNIGATFNTYTNTAYVTSNGSLASNLAKASVKVLPDKLFDTASIIGKVFEDRNGDGYQADATAKEVQVRANMPVQANTMAYLHQAGKSYRAKNINQVNVGTLAGVSRNRNAKASNIAVIEWRTSTRTPFDIQVTSQAGSHISISAAGKVTINHQGNKAKGLAAENLDVTRKLYRASQGYVWKLFIENKGVYEEGIPGVRLLTVEGIVIETDQFGRYHVPDQWVTERKGQNFLVKLDTDTLPTGMKVISENPKVLRISPNGLAKFNFSVQQKNSVQQENTSQQHVPSKTQQGEQ